MTPSATPNVRTIRANCRYASPLRLLFFALLGLSLTACSWLRFPGVYKVGIQQGNYLQQSKLDELKVGMTPNQVRYVLGTPLIEDSFNQDRWDYRFILKRGDEVFRDRNFTVYFEEGLLARWSGNVRPRTEEELAELEQRIASQRERQYDENVLTDENVQATNKETNKDPKKALRKNNEKSEEALEEAAKQNPVLEDELQEVDDFDPAED